MDHVGVILGLVAVLAGSSLVFDFRARRGASSIPVKSPTDGDNDPPPESAAGRPHVLVGLFVFLLLQTLVVLLVIWALAFQEVGPLPALALLIPAGFIFVHAWRLGAFKW